VTVDLPGKAKADTSGVQLALSGGGLRATLFHLGVVNALRQLDILRHIRRIACVSGGAIVGVHLVRCWSQYTGSSSEHADAVRELTNIARVDIWGRVARRLPLWLMSLGRRSAWTPTSVFQRLLDEHLYHGTTLARLGVCGAPEVRVCATNLSQKDAGYFTSCGYTSLSGDFTASSVTELPAAAAVTASCALPPYLTPLSLRMHDDSGGPSSDHLLADGGLFDSLALCALSMEDANKGMLTIVSDALGDFDWRGTSLFGAAHDIAMVRIGALALAQFENVASVAESRPMAYIDIRDTVHPAMETAVGEHVEVLPREVQQALAFTRSGVGRFRDSEIQRLIQHGHALTIAALECGSRARVRGPASQGIRTVSAIPTIHPHNLHS
jgi:predicted acylesterase/phospholipase RssA